MLDNQKKTRQNKTLLKFWVIAIFLLVGWYFLLQMQKTKITSISKIANSIVSFLPMDKARKEELKTIFSIIPEITTKEEKTFLVLFQDNNELRPGGGYIGSFGVLKIKGEKIVSINTYDTKNFDSKMQTKLQPPAPIEEFLKISDWELRDSNWSPDFTTNATKAEELYHLEGGEEQLNGVIAISTKLLPEFLEITGPVILPDFSGEYNSKNAIEKLQYEVEKGDVEEEVFKEEQKYVTQDLVKAILAKAEKSSLSDKKKLLKKIEQRLNEKDMMVYFKDSEIQDKVKKLGWDGGIKEAKEDYLMMVDANLASYKTDQVIDRTFDYTVDFSGEKPRATLDIVYSHSGRAGTWDIRDYNSYIRIFVPNESWLATSENISQVSYGTEENKKFFGGIVNVPIGTIKTVSFSYDLPDNVTFEDYKILIQKQSGLTSVKGKIKIIDKDGKTTGYEVELKRDWEVSAQQ